MSASDQAGEVHWHRACLATDLAEGSCEVVIGQRVIAIFHSPAGWFAIDGMCAHQGGPLAKGRLDGNCLTCPWHGWQYDVATGNNMLSGKPMLECYAIELRAGEVWVAIPAAHG